MSVTILRLAAAFYAAGAGAYVLFFARPKHVHAARTGAWLVALGFVVHGISIGFGCSEFGGREFFNLRGGFGMVGWVAAGAFLVQQRIYHLPSVGAFIVPLVLIAVLPGVVGLGPDAPWVIPQSIRGPSLTVHITAAAGGVVLFGFAFGVALMYLLQEREVKGKRFGALFSRLPSLDALDRLNQRLVRSGFVVYSVALVTGALVAKKAWGTSWSWDPQQITSLVVWLLYGAMVQLRHIGVHGRRYALLTLAGFLLVLGSMLALGAVPNLTRHGGSFQ
jgi:ABC-type transport system involved in cytochrome c biogenesis permease subunit